MKWIVAIGIMVLGLLAAMGWTERGELKDFWFELRKPELPPSRSYESVTNQETPPLSPAPGNTAKKQGVPVETVKSEPPASLPAEFNLAVPFTSQAPYGVWDVVHEDTCEEAALLMVDAYYDERTLTPESVEAELQALVSWQRERFGYFEDTDAEETATMMREFYGYKRVEVIWDITIEDIRKRVVLGLPVVIPLYGRSVGNPFYTPPGPDYHMMVIRGYTKDGRFITNDPGTRRGNSYLYDPNVLWNAIHDWNDGNILTGRKAMIVAYPH